jgi:hypothetical protein
MTTSTLCSPLVIYSFMQWMHHRLGIHPPPPPTPPAFRLESELFRKFLNAADLHHFIHPSLRNENENDQFSQRGKRDEDVAQFTFCENFSICLDNKLHSNLSLVFFVCTCMYSLECAIKLILNKNWQFSYFLFSISVMPKFFREMMHIDREFDGQSNFDYVFACHKNRGIKTLQ